MSELDLWFTVRSPAQVLSVLNSYTYNDACAGVDPTPPKLLCRNAGYNAGKHSIRVMSHRRSLS